MHVGEYQDGREVTYAKERSQFAVGGTDVTIDQVMEYDSFGQIEWISPEMQTWAQGLAAPAPTGAAEPKSGWFTRLPMWAKVLFVIFYPVSIPYGIWAMWKGAKFTQPVRIALSVVATFFLLTVFISAFTADASEGAIAKKTAPPEATVEAAKPLPVKAPEPEPIAPPVTAAASPAPTKTEPVPPAGPSAKELRYIAQVVPVTTEVGNSLGELSGVLSTNPEAVFTDDEVRMDVIVQMAIVKTGYSRIMAIKAPPRFRPAHADLLAAMKLYDRSMDKLAAGIDDFDSGSIESAAKLMSQGAKKMESATGKIRALSD